MNKTIKRELEVAFSKESQPIWFRITKYIVLITLLYVFWGNKLLWIILSILLVFALGLHFWYRYKTKAWTQSYRMWKYDGKSENGKKSGD